MDLKKKIIISLVSFWGIGIILALVFAGVLILQRNLTIPTVQASPATCTVDDDLEVTKTVDFSDEADCHIRASSVETDTGWYVSNTAECNFGEVLTGGGCYCSEDVNDNEVAIRISKPEQLSEDWADRWYCLCQRNGGGGTITAYAYAVCCF